VSAEGDSGSALNQQRQIARKLNNVSQALFGDDEDAASLEVLALPLPGIDFFWGCKVLRFPSPFTICPALSIMTAKQPGPSAVIERFGIVRPDRQRPIIALERVIKPL
jgi:hypothetical protein